MRFNEFNSIIVLSLLLFLLSTCGGGKKKNNTLLWAFLATPKQVDVTWKALNEKMVNRSGGGYKVCYSSSATYKASEASCTDVPYVSGAEKAPTQATITVPGLSTVYIYVLGYSSLNPQGTPSQAFQLSVY